MSTRKRPTVLQPQLFQIRQNPRPYTEVDTCKAPDLGGQLSAHRSELHGREGMCGNDDLGTSPGKGAAPIWVEKD
ncbi:hypothetical protein AC578_6554 [Pseudocercospora eumusae]|uniref:Uncharacterized protein n=1 Tax=Pseudocercospora eumusae TaxID=321146 RepID=A0A139HHU3_9PEZI|nr:hypothetical protein AC578_6554 [Pseudocercospora eumusae]